MSFATPEAALAFWFGLINYEQQTPQHSAFKLEHTRQLLRLLGAPQDRVRVVHVAGSKGKGSTSAMLAAVLQQAGHRTGLFTSPHLARVEERIRVDGTVITAAEEMTLLAEVAEVIGWSPGPPPAFRHLTTAPTFFEVGTALGFLQFERLGVAVAVVEVGLGGQFDSTNVCEPLVSVITSISFDHTRQLGNTLASIAAIKAGIVKPGRPTVSGADAPEARAVIAQVCRERAAPLWELGRDFTYRHEPGAVTASGQRPPRVVVTTKERTWPALELGLLGEHQAANAAVVIACVEELRRQGWYLPDAAVAGGLREVFWPARLEVVARRPFIVLDCAHNVASAVALAETLDASFPPGRRLLVFAGSADKDVAGMFRVLAPRFAQAFFTRYTDNPRGVAPEELARLWSAVSAAPVTLCAAPADALRSARTAAGADDLVCIAGSVFLAGELRPLLVGDEE
jgi:dihydrofolate synthase/folylpolyglutamate synthase